MRQQVFIWVCCVAPFLLASTICLADPTTTATTHPETSSELLRIQGLCQTYARPAEKIVYSEVPGDIPELLKHLGYNRGPSITAEMPPVPSVVLNVTPLTPFQRLQGAPAPDGAVVFLHDRQAPDGTHRLIALQYEGISDIEPTFEINNDLHPTIIQPATAATPAQIVSDSDFWMLCGAYRHRTSTPVNFQIYAGQPDPIDSTHFFFDYEMYGSHGTVDGWLKDHDVITIKVRSGPAWPNQSSTPVLPPRSDTTSYPPPR